MTKEEIQKLADKILLGTATEEEIIQYNRIYDYAEAAGRETAGSPGGNKAELEEELKKAIFQKAGIGKVSRINWLRLTAVAASIILILGLSWLFFSDSKKDRFVAQKSGKRSDSLSFVLRHEINTTGKEKRIQLADGSLIVLANNTEINYREPFSNTRDISLNGKAYFSVARDKSKPFTVLSGDISTTALGTEFTVTAYQNVRHIIVRLYEGKVVIKAVDKRNAKMKADVYLLPGQQFTYGQETTEKPRALKVKKTTPEQIMKEERVQDNPLLPKDVDAPWFMFNNQPLDKVLTYLSALYNVKIVYNKKDVDKVYFIAKYNKSESLETILKRIGALNNLTVTKSDSGFVITPPSQR